MILPEWLSFILVSYFLGVTYFLNEPLQNFSWVISPPIVSDEGVRVLPGIPYHKLLSQTVIVYHIITIIFIITKIITKGNPHIVITLSQSHKCGNVIIL